MTRINKGKDTDMIKDRLGKELLFFDGGMGTLRGRPYEASPLTWMMSNVQNLVSRSPTSVKRISLFLVPVLMYMRTNAYALPS